MTAAGGPELLGGLLREELARRDWTAAELARRLLALDGRPHLPQDVQAGALNVWRWQRAEDPRAGRVPGARNRRLLAAALGLPLERVRRACAASRAERARRRGYPGANQASVREEQEAAVDRREFLATGGALAAGAAAEAAGPLSDQEVAGTVAEAAELARLAEATEVGPTTIELLHAYFEDLAERFHTMPLERQFRELSAYHRRVAYLLTERRCRLSEARDLALLAAKTSTLQAQVVLDLGRPAATLELIRVALPHAADAGHPDALAWLHEVRTNTLYWQGRYQEALAEADAGLAHAPGGSAAAVLLHGHRARAAAMTGQPHLVRQALHDAERALGALPSAQLGRGFFATSEASQAFLASGALVRIHELAAAKEAAARAAALHAPGSEHEAPVSQALAEFNIALACCMEGAPDQAAALSLTLLDRFLAQPRRARQVVQAAAELAGLLAPYQELPEVRGFQDRLHELTAGGPPGPPARSGA